MRRKRRGPAGARSQGDTGLRQDRLTRLACRLLPTSGGGSMAVTIRIDALAGRRRRWQTATPCLFCAAKDSCRTIHTEQPPEKACQGIRWAAVVIEGRRGRRPFEHTPDQGWVAVFGTSTDGRGRRSGLRPHANDGVHHPGGVLPTKARRAGRYRLRPSHVGFEVPFPLSVGRTGTGETGFRVGEFRHAGIPKEG